MMSILLDISEKIDPCIIEVFDTVSQVLAELNMPYEVIGAYAWDLALHYIHSVKI